MYKFLLPQCCGNKVCYYPSTCTNSCCHSAVSIRFVTTPLHVKSLLPQRCVNKVCYYPSTCTSSCCHSVVSIRFVTNPLHVQVLTATVLCQQGFLLPNVQVLATTVLCQSCCLLPLYMYKSSLPQRCVNKFFYYPSTCTNPCCHSAVSISFFTNPLHVQVFTATVLCQ